MTSSTQGTLDVSVIIPSYNDPKGTRTTIESLSNQLYEKYEILPVDNNSTDKTGDVIQNLTEQNPNLVTPLEETDVQSSYAARNTGIEHASGDVLLFLDADMWVSETWVRDMATVLECNDYDYVGCNVEVVVNDQPNLWERYEQSLSFPVESYLERKYFVPTCALAVRREVFEEIGRFEHRLESGGDKEFGQRVHRAGFDQGYAESITAYHPARDSLAELRSKAQRIGRGRAQMRHYHSEIDDYAHPLHPTRFLPPSPWRLRDRYSGTSVSASEMIGFYALEYGLKLTQSANALREAVAIRWGE
ncbi:glycosyltransferase [Natronorubrum sp. FCH18a]|uniref:glycosyltransferase n=1 Tax=Natronorubrum sp. FCH18a TaxID=3447018 RepID=UPI003F515795